MSTTYRLRFRRLLAALMSFAVGGCTCTRCQMPWAVTEPHILKVPGLFNQPENEIFALCKWCQDDTTSEQRIEFYGYYYVRLIVRGVELEYKWDTMRGEAINTDWLAIRTAVLNEGNNHDEGEGNGGTDHHREDHHPHVPEGTDSDGSPERDAVRDV